MVLYKIIKKRKLKEKSLRILILGLDSAGKTSIIKSIKGESISDCHPTIGFHIHTLEHMGYVVHYWDVGGQKNLRCFWRNYFEETDGIIWVVDASDEDRLKLCKEELDILLNDEKLIGATLLILANKQDLPQCLNKQQIIDVCFFII
ncbi:ADP-ribosylation factor-like protein 2 [Thelohanellus kitauei]|uniref:ADP-ribosylation factor-like protein 2 n=1 Tax=Thelohanellus kitauei TaxID=669202 RepID=A0A0C2JGG7_THEKT|nr:ADP-ribosylation factor-like protein 2 [Thelohanellus kitauei]